MSIQKKVNYKNNIFFLLLSFVFLLFLLVVSVSFIMTKQSNKEPTKTKAEEQQTDEQPDSSDRLPLEQQQNIQVIVKITKGDNGEVSFRSKAVIRLRWCDGTTNISQCTKIESAQAQKEYPPSTNIDNMVTSFTNIPKNPPTYSSPTLQAYLETGRTIYSQKASIYPSLNSIEFTIETDQFISRVGAITLPDNLSNPTSGLPSFCKLELIKGDAIKRDTKYNIVLLADKYTDIKEFREDAQNVVNFAYSTNLSTFKTKKTTDGKEVPVINKLNFWLSADTTQNYGVFGDKYNPQPRNRLGWDYIKTFNFIRDCRMNVPLILTHYDLAKYGGAGGFADNLFMTGVVIQIRNKTPEGRNLNQQERLTSAKGGIHEIGHLMGLSDEYVYDKINGIVLMGPNCTSEDNSIHNQSLPCPKWADKQKYPNTGCIEGCSYSTWFRPSLTSVMRDSYNSNYFNSPSLEAWDNALAYYK